jgi:GGDEF domain-containing protein
VSVGLGLSNAADTHETAVFQRADRGVYLAKEQGRNRVVLVKD